MLGNPQIRRFLSGSLFAGAFIWTAVRYFGVEPEVVWVFLILSVVFVVLMIVVGLLLAPVIRWFRPTPTLLSKLEQAEKEMEPPSDPAPGNVVCGGHGDQKNQS